MRRALLVSLVLLSLARPLRAQVETIIVRPDVDAGISDLFSRFHQRAGTSSFTLGSRITRPVVRGFSGERLLILEDGIPTLSSNATDPTIVTGTSVPTADVVDILRGPDALAYGIGSTGGIINIRRDHVFSPNRAPALEGLGGKVRLGSEQNPSLGAGLVGGDVEYNFKSRGKLWLSADHKDSPDYRTPVSDGCGNGSDSDERTVPKSKEYRAEIAGAGAEVRLGSFTIIPTFRFGQYDYSIPACEEANAHAWKFDAQLQVKWRPGRTYLKYISTTVSWKDWDDRSQLVPGFAETEVHSTVKAATLRSELAFGTIPFNPGPEWAKGKIGMRAGGSWTEQNRAFLSAETEVNDSMQSLFAIGSLDLLKFPRLGPIEAGARWETHSLTGDFQQTPVGNRLNGKSFSIALPQLFEFFHLSYTHAHRVPSPYELYGFSKNYYEGIVEKGNPEASPEISDSFGARVSWPVNGQFKVLLGGYWSGFSSYLHLERQGASTSGLEITAFKSVGADFAGGELTLTAPIKWRVRFLMVDRIEASFDTAHTLGAAVRQTWKEPPMRTTIEAVLTLGERVRVLPHYERWYVRSGAQFSPEGDLKSQAAHLVSLRSQVRIRKTGFLDIELTNALHQTYRNPLSPSAGPLAEQGAVLRISYRLGFGTLRSNSFS